MRTVKIFIASSFELLTERKALEDFLYQKTKIWRHAKDIFFELVNWEDFIDAMSATRKQDDYNRALETCDIVVMLFWTKVGKYTDEEFETAWAHFKQHGKPYLYVYHKDAPAAVPLEPSMNAFLDKVRALGHFETVVHSEEEFILHFNMQLDKLYMIQDNKQKEQDTLTATAITKAEIIQLINDSNIVEAFDELNKKFLGKNDALNALINEFINPPGNFVMAMFTSRLKMFVNQRL